MFIKEALPKKVTLFDRFFSENTKESESNSQKNGNDVNGKQKEEVKNGDKEENVDFSNEDKAFDAFLEDDTPENKKKVHALWLKMEKDLE